MGLFFCLTMRKTCLRLHSKPRILNTFALCYSNFPPVSTRKPKTFSNFFKTVFEISTSESASSNFSCPPEPPQSPLSCNTFAKLVTPLPSIPQGIINDVSKYSNCGEMLSANPCVVIHLLDDTPTAAIF